MPVPEYTSRPNDPGLFNALVGIVNESTENHGSPFYLIFSPTYDPAADASYYLNNYPNEPEELYGVPGVMSDPYTIEQEIAHNPDLDVMVAGMLACGSSLRVGEERHATIWTFNTFYCGKYKRIGELSLSTIDRDGQQQGTHIYVINSNSSVWTKNFWDRRESWRQIVDHELEEVIGQTQNLVI